MKKKGTETHEELLIKKGIYYNLYKLQYENRVDNGLQASFHLHTFNAADASWLRGKT